MQIDSLGNREVKNSMNEALEFFLNFAKSALGGKSSSNVSRIVMNRLGNTATSFHVKESELSALILEEIDAELVESKKLDPTSLKPINPLASWKLRLLIILKSSSPVGEASENALETSLTTKEETTPVSPLRVLSRMSLDEAMTQKGAADTANLQTGAEILLNAIYLKGLNLENLDCATLINKMEEKGHLEVIQKHLTSLPAGRRNNWQLILLNAINKKLRIGEPVVAIDGLNGREKVWKLMRIDLSAQNKTEEELHKIWFENARRLFHSIFTPHATA